MKNLLKKYSFGILLCLMVLPVIGRADMPSQQVKTRITKSFKIVKGDRLAIDNQYGNIEIKTWAKNEARIEVVITNRGVKQDNRVHIEAAKSKSGISCKTVIDSAASAKSPASYSINYLVYLPADLPINIKNQFGNIKLGNYAGELDINQKFGDFTAGNLLAAGEIVIEQGNIDIVSMQGGGLNGRGFNHIKIAKVSGNVSAGFSSGDLLEMNFTKALSGLIIKSDNIRKINIGGLSNVDGFYKISVILSKFNNLSGQKFNESDLYPVAKSERQIDSLKTDANRVDTTKRDVSKDKIMPLKKLLELKMIKKLRTYESGDATAKCKVNIVASFSVVTISD
jgi:hypothetical protein